MALVEKFGEKLYSKDGMKDLFPTLCEAKYVLLYFSAMWCPNCKMMTKKLEKFYEYANKNGKLVEIVLISSDETEEDFLDYYEDQPWMAIQFDLEKNTQLYADYEIDKMPGLVLIDRKGEVYSRKCKEEINTKGNQY